MIVSLWILNRQRNVLWLWAVKLIFSLPFQTGQNNIILGWRAKKQQVHMRLVWRSADGAEQKDLGKLTQEPKSFKCTNVWGFIQQKENSHKRGWRLAGNKQTNKSFWTTIMPETKPPQMFMLSWIYIGFTSKPRPNWTKPLRRGLVSQRDSCNVTFNPNKSTLMPPMLYTNCFCSLLEKKGQKEEKV